MPGSRYDNNDIVRDHYTTWKRIPQEKIDAIPSYEYVIKFGERFDQIAYKNYGDGKLWWIIALMNGVGFEFTDVNVGDRIKIPFDIEDIYGLL